MFVAIPTAMPLEPLTSRFGNFEGRTRGSFSVPSKLSIQSTVSFSRSSSIASAVFARRHSVYRIAAGSSSIGWGETRGRDSWASSGMVLLDVQVHDFLRVLLDVLPARLDGLPHEDREQGIGGRGVLNRDLLQQAAGGIHRRLPELVGVHLA